MRHRAGAAHPREATECTTQCTMCHARMHPSPAFDTLPRPSQEEIRRAKLQDLCKLFDDFDADVDSTADADGADHIDSDELARVSAGLPQLAD